MSEGTPDMLLQKSQLMTDIKTAAYIGQDRRQSVLQQIAKAIRKKYI